MEGKAFHANLAISDPMAKTVLHSGIRFGRYRGAAPHRRDPRSDGQNSNLSTLKRRHKVGQRLVDGWKHTIVKLRGIVPART